MVKRPHKYKNHIAMKRKLLNNKGAVPLENSAQWDKNNLDIQKAQVNTIGFEDNQEQQ